MDNAYFLHNDTTIAKKCGRCKSKKLRNTRITNVVKEEEGTLFQNAPSMTCKKCGQIHVGIHAFIMEDVLQTWLTEGPQDETIH